MLFAGSQPKQIVNSLSSRTYITACFRAAARHFSDWDNTLYLAALLLPQDSLQSVSTWAGGGSESKYQPQDKLLQPTCVTAWLPTLLPLPLHHSPLCLHLEINTNCKGGRALLLPFKRDYSCSLCGKVWAAARSRLPGCLYHPVWMLILSLALSSPQRFPCRKPCFCQHQNLAISACVQSLLLKFYVAWSYLFRLVPNPPLQLIHLYSSPVTPIVLTVSPCRYVYLQESLWDDWNVIKKWRPDVSSQIMFSVLSKGTRGKRNKRKALLLCFNKGIS